MINDLEEGDEMADLPIFFLRKDKAVQTSRERCMMKSHDVWVLEGVDLLARGELQPWLDQKLNFHPQFTVKSACVHTINGRITDHKKWPNLFGKQTNNCVGNKSWKSILL